MGALDVNDGLIGASIRDGVGGHGGVNLGDLEGKKMGTSVGRLDDGS